MTKKNDDVMRLANNVRLLRERWEDSRMSLSEELQCFSPDTIRAYERGTRLVTDDYINALSKLYRIPFSMIKEQALTKELLIEYDKPFDVVAFFENHNFLFSTASTCEVGLQNEDFKQADKYLQQILDLDYTKELLTLTRQLYFKSFEEGGILAGAANTLMMLFVEYCHIPVYPDSLDMALKGQMSNGEFYVKYRNIWSDITPGKKDFLKDVQVIIDKCVSALSRTFDGRIYAEYYMALKYMICMIDNNRSYRENMELGSVMLMELDKIGNRFAQKAVQIFGLV